VAKIEAIYEADPLQTFEPNCPEQEKFLAATTKTQAAFAGNQAGKTTALVVKCLIQCHSQGPPPLPPPEYKVTPEARSSAESSTREPSSSPTPSSRPSGSGARSTS
jgi:hypothetical protein